MDVQVAKEDLLGARDKHLVGGVHDGLLGLRDGGCRARLRCHDAGLFVLAKTAFAYVLEPETENDEE